LLNLDTQILVFSLTGRLSHQERRLLDDDYWGISDIVLWELSMLMQRKRIALDFGSVTLQRVLSEITIWPITVEVAKRRLTLDFKSDPADELIAATSLAHGVPLLTRDTTMLRSRVVPLATA